MVCLKLEIRFTSALKMSSECIDRDSSACICYNNPLDMSALFALVLKKSPEMFGNISHYLDCSFSFELYSEVITKAQSKALL